MNVKRKIINPPIVDTLDSVIFGKLAIETYKDYLGNEETRYGGSIVYAARTCACCKDNVALVTKYNQDFNCIEKELFGKNTKLFLHQDKITQRITTKITHLPPFNDDLLKYYEVQNTPLTIDNIPDLKAYNYIFLEGCLGDYDKELIIACSKLGRVALDASAFLRSINEVTKILQFNDDNILKELAPYCSFLKLSIDESYTLTGKIRPKEACEIIKSWGAGEVIITKGNIICVMDANYNYIEERIVESLNLNRAYLDTTTFVSYVHQRLTAEPICSLFYACALGTLKLNRPGPLLCTKTDIDHYLKFFYYLQPVKVIEPVTDDLT